MDFISSIIQLEDAPTPNQETSQFSSNNPLWHQQQQTIPQDHHHHHHHHQLLVKPMQDHGMNIEDHAIMGNKSHEVVRYKRSKSSSCIDFKPVIKDDENTSSDHHQSCKRKKLVHRDIEKQRRQEMASLYSSLRSLLPLEYLKGKRAISDHIQEAVNYIKHTEEKIRKLSDKRNELKRLANLGFDSSMEAMKGSEEDSLTVKPCYIGVEVVIETCIRQEEFPLSRVLEILIQEGLNVVSCISTRVNQRMLHSIKSEVSEGSNIDTSEMQQKLTNSVLKRFAD